MQSKLSHRRCGFLVVGSCVAERRKAEAMLRNMVNRVLAVLIATAVSQAVAWDSHPGQSADAQVIGPIVGKAVKGDTSKPLRELAAEAAQAKPAEEADKGAQQVKAFLQKKHAVAAERGQLSPLADADLAKAFPKAAFYVLRFRQYPVAFEVPEGFSSGNLCVLQGEEVTLVSDDKSLQAFFNASLPAVMSDDDRRVAAKACLRIAQELHNDGFYRFKPLAEEKITAAAREATGVTHVDPQGGNKGQISATLAFDAKGKVAKAETKPALSPGVRPICQSTKLLDADPIVRRMAERDLVVIGSAALDYLLEQRAKASPELQQAIDAVWEQIVVQGR
jgi:hypothetical protein